MDAERARVDELAATDEFILAGEGTQYNEDPDGKALGGILAEAGWPGASNLHFRALERKLAAALQLLSTAVEYGDQRGARQERERIVEWLRANPGGAFGVTYSSAFDVATAIEREFAAPPEREKEK